MERKNDRISKATLKPSKDDELRKHSDRILSEEITYETVFSFVTKTSEKKDWKPATWNTRLAGVKAFVRFLSREDPWFIETYRRVKLIKSKRVPRRDPDYLTCEQIESAILNRPARKWIEFRDNTATQFLLATGLRAAELCNLKVEDIVWVSSRTIHVNFTGKGRKERVIPITDPGLIKNLYRLIFSEELKSAYVFPNSLGTNMTTANLADRLRTVFKGLDVDHTISPHTIRRSAAMNWLNRGMDYENISGLLGHEHIATTEKYARSNLQRREAELKRTGITSKGLKVFEADEDQDQFLERLKRMTRRKPRSLN